MINIHNMIFKEVYYFLWERLMMDITLDFYKRLNNLDDKFLEKNNFSRVEIEQGLKDIAKEFGISI